MIALSPRSLMATNRFVCEICGKGFQRDQNLQLHRRGHNLPWKLKQRSSKEIKKKVYVCPEKTCVHHYPSRALGDLTGIKKHFSRKHGEKKWKCDKCSKKYAVQSDWKAHSKTCGTREYKCDCGTIFARKDSFITHRAFCDALTEESMRLSSSIMTAVNDTGSNQLQMGVTGNMYFHNHSSYGTTQDQKPSDISQWLVGRQMEQSESLPYFNPIRPLPSSSTGGLMGYVPEENKFQIEDSMAPILFSSSNMNNGSHNDSDIMAHMSATALLQKAAQIGASVSNSSSSMFAGLGGLLGRRSVKSLQDHHHNNNNETQTHENATSCGNASAGNMRIPEWNQHINPCHVERRRPTRDFLGLDDGRENSCRPLLMLQQELAKITSMGNNKVDLTNSSGYLH